MLTKMHQKREKKAEQYSVVALWWTYNLYHMWWMSLVCRHVGSFNQSLLIIWDLVMFVYLSPTVDGIMNNLDLLYWSTFSLFTLVLYWSMEQMSRRRNGWHLFAPVKELAALLSVNQVPWEIILFTVHIVLDCQDQAIKLISSIFKIDFSLILMKLVYIHI